MVAIVYCTIHSFGKVILDIAGNLSLSSHLLLHTSSQKKNMQGKILTEKKLDAPAIIKQGPLCSVHLES